MVETIEQNKHLLHNTKISSQLAFSTILQYFGMKVQIKKLLICLSHKGKEFYIKKVENGELFQRPAYKSTKTVEFATFMNHAGLLNHDLAVLTDYEYHQNQQLSFYRLYDMKLVHKIPDGGILQARIATQKYIYLATTQPSKIYVLDINTFETVKTFKLNSKLIPEKAWALADNMILFAGTSCQILINENTLIKEKHWNNNIRYLRFAQMRSKPNCIVGSGDKFCSLMQIECTKNSGQQTLIKCIQEEQDVFHVEWNLALQEVSTNMMLLSENDSSLVIWNMETNEIKPVKIVYENLDFRSKNVIAAKLHPDWWHDEFNLVIVFDSRGNPYPRKAKIEFLEERVSQGEFSWPYFDTAVLSDERHGVTYFHSTKKNTVQHAGYIEPSEFLIYK